MKVCWVKVNDKVLSEEISGISGEEGRAAETQVPAVEGWGSGLRLALKICSLILYTDIICSSVLYNKSVLW